MKYEAIGALLVSLGLMNLSIGRFLSNKPRRVMWHDLQISANSVLSLFEPVDSQPKLVISDTHFRPSDIFNEPRRHEFS